MQNSYINVWNIKCCDFEICEIPSIAKSKLIVIGYI